MGCAPAPSSRPETEQTLIRLLGSKLAEVPLQDEVCEAPSFNPAPGNRQLLGKLISNNAYVIARNEHCWRIPRQAPAEQINKWDIGAPPADDEECTRLREQFLQRRQVGGRTLKSGLTLHRNRDGWNKKTLINSSHRAIVHNVVLVGHLDLAGTFDQLRAELLVRLAQV